MTGFVADIAAQTEDNDAYRHVLYTGHHLQLVLMTLPPGGDIGAETHSDHDQFFRIESGHGAVVINGTTHVVTGGDGVVIPAGAAHNIANIGDRPLRMHTIYGPPHHLDRLVEQTKAVAEATIEKFDGVASE